MNEKKPVLEHINGPCDIKNLTAYELKKLASEIRHLICATVNRNGGHLSSNLGVVELAIALHRVFDSPEDKIIWDVGHQCYAHKILTGRREAFDSLRLENGISGFPKRNESLHDPFGTGHASTSVSAALGFLVGERLSGGKALAIAVIGDGALTGGPAYEALSHAGQLGMPLIVILNDNRMSISPNVGGLSKYLSHLSMKGKYQNFRRSFDGAVKNIPALGKALFGGITRLKRAVKAAFYIDNFFVDLGFEYVGPVNGHDIERLEEVLRDVQKINLPVVVHILTQKGKGYQPAEQDPSAFHAVAPSAKAPETADGKSPVLSFTRAFGDAMLEFGVKERRLVAITAAMEHGTGLSAFHAAFPDRFFDAGIAEAHAVTFAAALAARGLRPVAAIYSTFLQRAIDQIVHDAALQKLPVIFAVDRAGFVAGDGETHQGLFDISLLRAVPNMTLLAPACDRELRLMLEWALREDGPCAIRYPKASARPENIHPDQQTASAGNDSPALPPIERGRGVFVEFYHAPSAQEDGRKPENVRKNILVAFTGSLYPSVESAARLIRESNISADFYNLRFLKPVDEDYLAALIGRYRAAVFVEEGAGPGGFGEYASALSMRRKCPAKILSLNAGNGCFTQGSRSELLVRSGLDGEGIASGIRALL
ncbi:MAG: 1-deoxy-D-xylulose-5-phosphate synthase [Spirochaetaceae bacterium]|jgi:1-deoxy-D-xylulose-5-phosphate synthase|nr:1-deoxy-D-xylulose-5-phosphate synthase [Spirochaetaceae bacterium]